MLDRKRTSYCSNYEITQHQHVLYLRGMLKYGKMCFGSGSHPKETILPGATKFKIVKILFVQGISLNILFI
jgi:hypothetical protein